MRFVSAYYTGYYPFNELNLFDEFYTAQNPNDLKKGDVLCVWGGADIYPGFYKKTLSSRSYAHHQPTPRDMIEWALMTRAKDLGIPIIGICRGAQMLCALAGGYLMQHVNNHGGRAHEVVTNKGTIYYANSLHHQMMVPANTKHIVLAEIPKENLLSDVYWDENNKVDHTQEPEMIFFNDVKGLAVQWHPEMMPVYCAATQDIKQQLQEHLGL